MTFIAKALAALAAAAFIAAPQAALAQKEKPGMAVAPAVPDKPGYSEPVYSDPATIDLEVCNNSGVTAAVAVSYLPVGESVWYNEGWFTVDPGACEILATTGNNYFYAYAEQRNSGELFWGGDFDQCVQYPGPFALWDDGGAYCPDDYESVGFREMHATATGYFTWHLDP